MGNVPFPSANLAHGAEGKARRSILTRSKWQCRLILKNYYSIFFWMAPPNWYHSQIIFGPSHWSGNFLFL